MIRKVSRESDIYAEIWKGSSQAQKGERSVARGSRIRLGQGVRAKMKVLQDKQRLLQAGVRAACSTQTKNFSRQKQRAPSYKMVPPGWRKPVQRPQVENLQFLKGQLTRGKKGGGYGEMNLERQESGLAGLCRPL